MKIINDTDITITHILEDSNCDPIDVSTFSGITAKVFQKGYEIAKYSKNAQLGFRTIDLSITPTDGTLTFYLNADDLRLAVDSIEVFYEIKTEIANTNFDNNTKEESIGPIFLGKLIKTELTNITFT
jgi:hypothetical protein